MKPLELRVKDVDVEAGFIVMRAAKGNKGRIVALPECLKEAMAAQLGVARALAKSDLEVVPVSLPGLVISHQGAESETRPGREK